MTVTVSHHSPSGTTYTSETKHVTKVEVKDNILYLHREQGYNIVIYNMNFVTRVD